LETGEVWKAPSVSDVVYGVAVNIQRGWLVSLSPVLEYLFWAEWEARWILLD
jgi:hypothetical protein